MFARAREWSVGVGTVVDSCSQGNWTEHSELCYRKKDHGAPSARFRLSCSSRRINITIARDNFRNRTPFNAVNVGETQPGIVHSFISRTIALAVNSGGATVIAATCYPFGFLVVNSVVATAAPTADMASGSSTHPTRAQIGAGHKSPVKEHCEVLAPRKGAVRSILQRYETQPFEDSSTASSANTSGMARYLPLRACACCAEITPVDWELIACIQRAVQSCDNTSKTHDSTFVSEADFELERAFGSVFSFAFGTIGPYIRISMSVLMICPFIRVANAAEVSNIALDIRDESFLQANILLLLTLQCSWSSSTWAVVPSVMQILPQRLSKIGLQLNIPAHYNGLYLVFLLLRIR